MKGTKNALFYINERGDRGGGRDPVLPEYSSLWEILKNRLFYQNRSGSKSCFIVREIRFYWNVFRGKSCSAGTCSEECWNILYPQEFWSTYFTHRNV